ARLRQHVDLDGPPRSATAHAPVMDHDNGGCMDQRLRQERCASEPVLRRVRGSPDESVLPVLPTPARWSLELPWETWVALIAFVRGTRIPFAEEHAARIHQYLSQGPTDQPQVRITFTDIVVSRSVTFACIGLGIPLPAS